MRVVCINDDCGWDQIPEGPSAEIGKIYTAIDVIKGYGRFKWWPFPVDCYMLAGFPKDCCYPVKNFIKIKEDEEPVESSQKVLHY